MEKYLVTIIVPIYNIERHLEKCIESLVNQTYKNLQIILIDDGSKDNSGKICDKYKKDNRIVIFHNENMGVSKTRNFGLEQAKGDYILFVDGDDWIDNNYVEILIGEVNSHKEQVDIVLTGYIREYSTKAIKNNLFKENYIEFDSTKIKYKILRRLYGVCDNELKQCLNIDDFSAPWGKLCRAEIVKKYRFMDMQEIGTEDGFFNLQWIINAKFGIYIQKPYYHYNKQNNNSLIQNYKEYLFKGWKQKYILMKKEIEDNRLDDSFVNALNNRIIIDLFALLRNLYISDKPFFEKKKIFLNIVSDKIYEERFKKFHFENLDVKWKFFYKACKEKKFFATYFMLQSAEYLKKYIKKGI